MVKSRRSASSDASPNTLSLRMSSSSPLPRLGSSDSSLGFLRNVAVSMTLPPWKSTWTSRKRRPMMRELRNSSRTSSGRALVATSKSLGLRSRSRSRTPPPTR